jgi:hypothetical protein
MHASLLLVAVLLSVATAHDIEIETFIENDLVMVKIGTIHGLRRTMALSMDGRVSTCDIATKDAAFTDVTGAMIRPLMNFHASLPCEMDLKFLFTRYRQLILTHNSIIFTEEALTDGEPCMRDATTRGLCETRASGVTLRWFSDRHLYYENAREVDALGVTLPPAMWSVRSPKPIVDVSEAYMVERVNLHYDIISHTIAAKPRVPSLGLKIATSLAAGLVSFLFVTRLMLEHTWRRPALHWTMIGIAIATTALALVTRANGLHSVVFLLSTAGVTLAHLGVEIARFLRRQRLEKQHRKALPFVDLKPDMAILLVAMILSFYGITSHSLIVIPMLLAMLYIVKTLAELLNLRSVRVLHTTDQILISVCLVVDTFFSATLWRYVVGDFLAMTLVANWYLQEFLLSVVVVLAALYVANITDTTAIERVSTGA